LILGICSALAVNECCELSPWAAQKIARWSAHLRYADPDRAETRAEELAAVIDERPGKIFKLITAMCFAVAAIRTWAVRAAIRACAAFAASDVSVVSITPTGRVMLRKAIAASVLAAAAALAVLLVVSAGLATPTSNTVTISLEAVPGGSAAGEATVNHTAGGWTTQLSVRGLSANDFYEGWFVRPDSQTGHSDLIFVGNFVVSQSGSATLISSYTVDPRGSAMEITRQPHGDRVQPGQVILAGTANG
jgi:hypothetical protein